MARGLKAMLLATPGILIFAFIIAIIAGVAGLISVFIFMPEPVLADITAIYCGPDEKIESWTTQSSGGSSTVYFCTHTETGRSGVEVSDQVFSAALKQAGTFAGLGFILPLPFLLFLSFVRGMFRKPGSRIKLVPNAAPLTQSNQSPISISFTPNTGTHDSVQQLQALQQLLDNGLISRPEFERKKAKILADI